jgi:hypothetical protein
MIWQRFSGAKRSILPHEKEVTGKGLRILRKEEMGEYRGT